MTETLMDKSAESRVESEENPEVEEIVSDITVKNSTIKYQNLREDEWKRVCSIKTLARNSVDFVVNKRFSDARVPSEVVSKLRELDRKLAYAWDEKSEKFRLECRYDSEGRISELVIPLETPISSDQTVARIHNEKGEFVADNIWESMEEDLYKLETKELRVTNTRTRGKRNVYEQEEKEFRERFEDAMENQNTGPWEDPNPSFDEVMKEFGFVTGLSALVYAFLGGIYAFAGYGAFLLVTVVLNFAYFLPFVLPIAVFVMAFSIVRASIRAKLSEGEVKTTKLFRTS